MESYFDLSFSALMALTSFYRYGLEYFFETTDDIISTVLTLLFSILICLYPCYNFSLIKDLYINKNMSRLKQLEVLLSSCHYETLNASFYEIYFIVRRLLIVASIVLLKDYPQFQLCFILVLTFMQGCYLMGSNPLKTEVAN